MYVNHDDLQAIASALNSQEDSILSAMDDEVVSLKCKVGKVALHFYWFLLTVYYVLDTIQ